MTREERKAHWDALKKEPSKRKRIWTHLRWHRFGWPDSLRACSSTWRFIRDAGHDLWQGFLHLLAGVSVLLLVPFRPIVIASGPSA